MSAREAEKGDERPLVEYLSAGRGAISIEAGPRTGPSGTESVATWKRVSVSCCWDSL
jgi:hypothetical protein